MRFLSFLLLAMMMVSLLTVGVFAESEQASTSVAKIGTAEHATLEEAFAAAQEGETITLLADATPALTSQRAIIKAAVIDLNGKTLTLTEDDLYFGTTTFMNGTIVQTGRRQLCASPRGEGRRFVYLYRRSSIQNRARDRARPSDGGGHGIHAQGENLFGFLRGLSRGIEKIHA